MTFGYYQNLHNSNYNMRAYPVFQAGNNAVSPPLAKPIDTVQKTIEGSVDTFVQKVDQEKKKKSNKTAIAAGSSVLVIAGLVAFLNPKFSSKLISKLSELSEHAGTKLKGGKNSFLKSNFYKVSQKVYDGGARVLQFSNNINSAKDIGFKYLCCENKKFSGIKNKSVKKVLQKIDTAFVKVMKKIHETITKWFDTISRKTVKSKYNKVSQNMNSLENLIQQYKGKLSSSEQQQLEAKIKEIAEARKYFSEQNINTRLIEQESMMSDLERDFMLKFRSYRQGFSNKWVNNSEHINKNMTFWAEQIMQPKRAKVEAQGLANVENLIGNGIDKKGLYNEVYSLLSPHMSQEERAVLEKALNKTSEKLRKANHSECVEYFDKKRDLVLGGAPTDIVTAVIGLGLSGAAIASADTKEDKVSKALTRGFPIISGIGASLAFTAMLFSGVQGMLLGAGTSIVLSKIGSLANHYIIGNKDKTEHSPANSTNNPFKSQEVINA